jgi:hypothetical protein
MNSASGRGGIRTHTPVTREGISSPQSDSTSADPIALSDDAYFDPTSRAHSKNELDADLQRVLDAWPTLPDPVRGGIVAMIGACKPQA